MIQFAVDSNRGAVLIFTFLIMIPLLATTLAFLYIVSTQQRSSGYDLASLKALWLAEAGIQSVIYQLKNDADFRDSVSEDQNNPTVVNGSLGDGSYSVSLYKGQPGQPDENTFYLTSQGTVGVLNRQVTQSLVVSGGVPEAFEYALHSGGNINFKNSVGTVNGDISTGGQVKNEDDMTINGTITEASTVVTPSVDTDSYAAVADNVISGNKTFEEGEVYTGIWYVDGKVTIEDDVTINGSVVATGNIILQKSKGITISPDAGYPALVSDKNIEAKQLEDSTISGLVYAAKEVNLNKNEENTFNGTIIAGQKILIKNSEDFTITYDASIVSNPPPYFSGGETETTVVLQKDWNEVVPPI